MRTNYLLALLFIFGMITANAQFAEDDMESYGGSNTPIFESKWSSWDGTIGPALLSSGSQANSGALSGYINDDPVAGVNALLLLGDKIFGSWGLKFSLYIPAGNVGYWNLQGQETPGIQSVVGNIFMGKSGVAVDGEAEGRIDMNTTDETDDFTFTFPKDQWFNVVVNFDFNAGASASTWNMWVQDGTTYALVIPYNTDYADGTGTFALAIGAINFYAISTDNEMYIDDVEFFNVFYPDPNLGVNDLDATGFTAYPNPVKNVLNIQANEEIYSAVIYNLLGQEVYNANINALTATINMASFASGAYFVKVTVGGIEGVIKVLK